MDIIYHYLPPKYLIGYGIPLNEKLLPPPPSSLQNVFQDVTLVSGALGGERGGVEARGTLIMHPLWGRVA